MDHRRAQPLCDDDGIEPQQACDRPVLAPVLEPDGVGRRPGLPGQRQRRRAVEAGAMGKLFDGRGDLPAGTPTRRLAALRWPGHAALEAGSGCRRSGFRCTGSRSCRWLSACASPSTALAGESYDHAAWPHVFFYESLKISIFIGLFTMIALRHPVLPRAAGRAPARRARQRLLRKAQLQRLAQQMQPHFLFNALNTISSLMHTDVRQGRRHADPAGRRAAHHARHGRPATRRRSRRSCGWRAATPRVMAERFADRVRIDWHIDDGAAGLHACRS